MVEQRENRIHMYLSNEERDAIDDWRYANRVATRSEAIRRLCQIGLTFDQSRSDLVATYMTAQDAATRIVELSKRAAEDEITEAEKELMLAGLDTYTALISMFRVLNPTAGIAANFKGDQGIDTLISDANEIRAMMKINREK